MITLAVLVISSAILCRAGYGLEIAAVAFVFSLSAVIVRSLDNERNQSRD